MRSELDTVRVVLQVATLYLRELTVLLGTTDIEVTRPNGQPIAATELTMQIETIQTETTHGPRLATSTLLWARLSLDSQVIRARTSTAA
jgi:hypothetical protein